VYILGTPLHEGQLISYRNGQKG